MKKLKIVLPLFLVLIALLVGQLFLGHTAKEQESGKLKSYSSEVVNNSDVNKKCLTFSVVQSLYDEFSVKCKTVNHDYLFSVTVPNKEGVGLDVGFSIEKKASKEGDVESTPVVNIRSNDLEKYTPAQLERLYVKIMEQASLALTNDNSINENLDEWKSQTNVFDSDAAEKEESSEAGEENKSEK